MIRAVTFDLWWTIFNYTEAIVERRLALLYERLRTHGWDADIEGLRDAYTSSQCLFEGSWERSERSFSPQERVESILERVGISLPPNELGKLVEDIEDAALVEPPDLVEGAGEALNSLQRSYQLGIISDTGMTPGRVLRVLLERAGMLRLFSVSLFSDEVGYYKPHPEIFRRALRDLGVRPQEAVHLGDNPETDVKGAKGVGMRAILFNPSGATEMAPGVADAVINSYGPLEEVVGRL